MGVIIVAKEQHKLAKENFKKAGIEPKEGLVISFKENHKIITAVITKVEKDIVIVSEK